HSSSSAPSASAHLFILSLLLRPPPSSTLFPYTTLFRSTILAPGIHAGGAAETLPACLDCQHVFADAQFARHDTHDLLVAAMGIRSEEHTSELQSRENLVCRLLLEKKKKKKESKYQNTRR